MFIWVLILTVILIGLYISLTYDFNEPDVLTDSSIIPRKKMWTNNRASVIIRSDSPELAHKTAQSLADTGTGIMIRVFTYNTKTEHWPDKVKVETVACTDVLPSMEELVIMVEDRAILAVEGGLIFISDPQSMFDSTSKIWIDHTPDTYIAGSSSIPGSIQPTLLESVFLIDKKTNKNNISLMKTRPFQECWKGLQYKVPHLIGTKGLTFAGTHRLIGHESNGILIIPGTGNSIHDLKIPDMPWQVQVPSGKLMCGKFDMTCTYADGKIISV